MGGRRADVISPHYILRDMVLKRGGAMSIADILCSREFRKGYEKNDIYSYVYQLRKEHRGHNLGYGVEAWEMLGGMVIGLESKLSQYMRWRIHKRKRAKEIGVAEQTVYDSQIFQAKIERDGVAHKEEIIHVLEASDKDLEQAAKSSTTVRDTLVEHKEDFGNETS